MLVEEKDYEVTLTLRLTTTVRFAPMERDREITKSDAIDNAIRSLPVVNYTGYTLEVLEAIENEGFSIAYPIDGEATEL